jgi:hypothetical protein
MKSTIRGAVCTGLLVLSVIVAPRISLAQQTAAGHGGVSVLGSIFLSVLHLPLKLATCVGTQAGAAVAYTATFGVAGNHDGGTNGKQIGEVARRSCTGDWIITPEQVERDYQ